MSREVVKAFGLSHNLRTKMRTVLLFVAVAVGVRADRATCGAADFPLDLTDQECMGLKATTPAMGSQTAVACMQACPENYHCDGVPSVRISPPMFKPCMRSPQI